MANATLVLLRRVRIGALWERALLGDGAMRKSISLLFITIAFLSLTQPTFGQQTTKIHRIGVIMTGTPDDHGTLMPMLRKGLKALNFLEGRDFTLEPRYDMRDRSRLQKLAEDLLKSKIDVIVVTGAGAAREAQRASSTIPIVVATSGHLLRSGLIKNLAEPGGNVTGNTAYSGELGGKQLQLLKEAIPDLKRVGVLYSRTLPSRSKAHFVKQTQETGAVLGVEVHDFQVKNSQEIYAAFEAMRKARTDAVIFVVSRLTSVHRKELIKLAKDAKIPAMCWRPSMARDGCLMSYGADRGAMYLHTATFVHKILQGAKPNDLPVQQPTKFGLAINLKVAKALGVTVPNSLMLRADKVIE